MISLKKLFQVLYLILLIGGICYAYDGSEAWLHYSPVTADLKTDYSSVCQKIILSNPDSDTLKNAKSELDLAIPRLLGGSALRLTTAVEAGAIVLAPEGSPLVAAAGIEFSAITTGGFVIKSSGGATYISGKSEVGVLRGVFHFLRLMQTGKPIDNLAVVENPYFAYRVLDHWINHYNSNVATERLYGGDRPFKMENFGALSPTELQRVRDYCRMAVSLGLNGMCPDNVNTYRGGHLGNYKCLEEANLATQKTFCDIIGTYGLKYYLSVSYTSPRLISPTVSSANAYSSDEAKQWWSDRVDMIRSYISNFGGFLMKADSEGEEGPRTTYGLSQSQGANPIAEVLARYGYILIWRTFIYATSDPDFAVNQSVEFENQSWNEAVVLRTKDGPRDFQTVEPPNQLVAMPGVRHGMEFQITQEYTGQDKHVTWLVPKWKEMYDFDMQITPPAGTNGSVTYELLRGDGTATNGGGVWGISNVSDAANWTGHYLAQANYYGFGRLAWNPRLSEEEIAEEWISCSFAKGNDSLVRYVVKDMLEKSWKTYEDYTISYSALMPALEFDSHYEITFDGMHNSRFFSPYFMNLTGDGIGVDRTPSGNNGVRVYPEPLQQLFGTTETCPEEYLLFFHHLPWEYTMKSGMTLIQSLYHNHYRGLRQVRRFIQNWDMLRGVVDDEIQSHVTLKLQTQLTDATRWTETFKNDFGSKYTAPVGCDIAIVTPSPNHAIQVDVGDTVGLSAVFKNQNGEAVMETFTWSVNEGSAALSAFSGLNTVFSSERPGVYTVTLATGTFPELNDKVQIFVGDTWHGHAMGSNNRGSVKRLKKKLSLRVSQGGRKIAVGVPVEGELEIVDLQGSVATSLSVAKAGVYWWDTRGYAGGMYVLRLKSRAGILLHKLLLR